MRIFWIKLFFSIFFFCILVRLFYWQVVRADFLQAQAESQHFTNTKVQASRGNIQFSDGFILASSSPSFSLFAQPKLIPKDKIVETSYFLAKVLAEDKGLVEPLAKDFINKLSQDLYWVSLKKNISY